METTTSAQVERSRLQEFRQQVYEHGFARQRNALFESLDALLLSGPIRSFAELSLCPVFRRGWSSLYGALKLGVLDEEWLRRFLARQAQSDGLTVFDLDGSAWPRPKARSLQDRQYVHSATSAVNGGSVVVGYPYSLLCWSPIPGSSFAPPVDVRRVSSKSDLIEVGVAQVKALDTERRKAGLKAAWVVAVDAGYGNHRFLGGVRDLTCGVLARLRKDRVLYGEPGAYGGQYRPRKHGDRFDFKDPGTWGPPAETIELEDGKWGRVKLSVWKGLHAKKDAGTRFEVVRAAVHQERERPPSALWLAWIPPEGQEPPLNVEQTWRLYPRRWCIEPSLRFGKQELHWTLPRFQDADAGDRWSWLVALAHWELFQARNLVQDARLPWQPPQTELKPGRVKQGLGALFTQIGTPALAPQTRGKSSGWPIGRARKASQRYKVVYKAGRKPKTQATGPPVASPTG